MTGKTLGVSEACRWLACKSVVALVWLVGGSEVG